MTPDLTEPAFSWLAVIALCAAFYVIGKISERAKNLDWVSWMVGENRRLATALRKLYGLAGVAYPTDEELDPEPEPTRWQRLRAWLRAMRRDEPVGTPAVEITANPSPEGETRRDTGEVDATYRSPDEIHSFDEPEDVDPDPAPVTQPIVMPDPGPATVPATVVAGDTFALILAEHEASMVKLRGEALESIRQMAESSASQSHDHRQ